MYVYTNVYMYVSECGVFMNAFVIFEAKLSISPRNAA